LVAHTVDDAGDYQLVAAFAVVDDVLFNGETSDTRLNFIAVATRLWITCEERKNVVMESTTPFAISVLPDLLAISYQISSKSRSARLETRIRFTSRRS
jgi:hypothetical protein